MHSACNVMQRGQLETTIFTDASSNGWRAVLGSTTSQGAWSPSEAPHHVNFLEILAMHFAFKAFRTYLEGKYVRVMIDNTTAVTTLAHMGTSHSPLCNNVTHLKWGWCQVHPLHPKLVVLLCHVSGSNSKFRDYQSRLQPWSWAHG